MLQHFSCNLVCWSTELLRRGALQSASFQASVLTWEAWNCLLPEKPSWITAILLYRTLSEGSYELPTSLTVLTEYMKCSGSYHCVLQYLVEACLEIFLSWSFSSILLFRGSRIDYVWLTTVSFILGQKGRFYIIVQPPPPPPFFFYWSIVGEWNN